MASSPAFDRSGDGREAKYTVPSTSTSNPFFSTPPRPPPSSEHRPRPMAHHSDSMLDDNVQDATSRYSFYTPMAEQHHSPWPLRGAPLPPQNAYFAASQPIARSPPTASRQQAYSHESQQQTQLKPSALPSTASRTNPPHVAPATPAPPQGASTNVSAAVPEPQANAATSSTTAPATAASARLANAIHFPADNTSGHGSLEAQMVPQAGSASSAATPSNPPPNATSKSVDAPPEDDDGSSSDSLSDPPSEDEDDETSSSTESSSPDDSERAWSREETDLLATCVQMHGKLWDVIEKEMRQAGCTWRSASSIRSRYYRKLHKERPDSGRPSASSSSRATTSQAQSSAQGAGPSRRRTSQASSSGNALRPKKRKHSAGHRWTDEERRVLRRIGDKHSNLIYAGPGTVGKEAAIYAEWKQAYPFSQLKSNVVSMQYYAMKRLGQGGPPPLQNASSSTAQTAPPRQQAQVPQPPVRAAALAASSSTSTHVNQPPVRAAAIAAAQASSPPARQPDSQGSGGGGRPSRRRWQPDEEEALRKIERMGIVQGNPTWTRTHRVFEEFKRLIPSSTRGENSVRQKYIYMFYDEDASDDEGGEVGQGRAGNGELSAAGRGSGGGGESQQKGQSAQQRREETTQRREAETSRRETSSRDTTSSLPDAQSSFSAPTARTSLSTAPAQSFSLARSPPTHLGVAAAAAAAASAAQRPVPVAQTQAPTPAPAPTPASVPAFYPQALSSFPAQQRAAPILSGITVSTAEENTIEFEGLSPGQGLAITSERRFTFLSPEQLAALAQAPAPEQPTFLISIQQGGCVQTIVFPPGTSTGLEPVWSNGRMGMRTQIVSTFTIKLVSWL